MTEAVVLGSGTSQGVPMIGFSYPDSFLANPKNHRYRCSILIRGDEGNILVDCPPELRLQMLREKVMSLDAVVLTHTHADHMMGMDDLRTFCDLQGIDMPVYTLEEHFHTVRQVFPYAFQRPPAGFTFPQFELHEAGELQTLAGMPFQFFTVRHGTMPVIGMRVGDFAYVTDVKTVPDSVYEILDGVENLIVDGLRKHPHPSHFSFDEAIQFARRVKAKTAYLTHLTHDTDHDVTERELPEGIFLAYDGLRVPISL